MVGRGCAINLSKCGERNMGKGLVYLAMITIAIGVASGARAAPVSQDDFLATNTANLVSLCSAAETDPLYTPARNFCEGFLVGTYRMIITVQAAMRSKRKVFCAPANGPTRDQAVAAFTQ